jgi:4-amino-4-deoxy-L-arabinose transferase-like glycosyltransferase
MLPGNRRTLDRLFWLCAALALGWLGQSLLRQRGLWESATLYLGAALLFVFAAPHFTAQERSEVAPSTSQGERPPLIFGYGAIAGALILSIAGLLLFRAGKTQPEAWGDYLLSLLALLAGLILLSPGAGKKALVQLKHPNGWLLMIMLIALAARFYRFNDLPYGIWYDEAEAGLVVRRMLAEPIFRPIFWVPINMGGHLLLLYSFAARIFGDQILSLRLVSALFGFMTVPAAYFFGKETVNTRFGLIMAFLLAAMRWHLNFSRIAMTGIDTPFFEILSLYFLHKAFTRREMIWYGLAGLTLGLGLCFYTAFRLFIAGLFLCGSLYVISRIIRDKSWFKRQFSGLGRHLIIGVIAFLLAVMPIALFAILKPLEYGLRTQQVSVFVRRDQADIVHALWDNTWKHLLMFNMQGDRNGRHNLPGEPMLDSLMAVSFVLGLALAARNFRRPANLVMLGVFASGLAGGIFSVDFEAPQALRSIGAMPAVLYFCALPLEVIYREGQNTLQKPFRIHLWIGLPLLVLLISSGVDNLTTFFSRQANDNAVWSSFSTAETIAGNTMRAYGTRALYYFSPFLSGHPTIRYLAPPGAVEKLIRVPDALPIREPPDKAVILFIRPDEIDIFRQAQSYYPGAEFTKPSLREDTAPALLMANLAPADIGSIQGLDLAFYSTTKQTGSPVRVEHVDEIDVDWRGNPPVEPPFEAVWNGILYAADYGRYDFRLPEGNAGNLYLDNTLVIASPQRQGSMLLAQGNHALLLSSPGGAQIVNLQWKIPKSDDYSLVPSWAFYGPPVTGNGLLGKYYANGNWQGAPSLMRIDPDLDIYFHLVPLPRPYTVAWTGWLEAPQSGSYVLQLAAVDKAELWLDGSRLILAQGAAPPTEAIVALDSGKHALKITFADLTSRTQIHLSWVLPDGTQGIIPSRYFTPASGE